MAHDPPRNETAEADARDPVETPPETAGDPQQSRKARRPAERILVWVLILALAGVAGWEALTRFGHQHSVDAVDTAFRQRLAGVGILLQSDEVQELTQAKIDAGMSEEAAEGAALREVQESGSGVSTSMTLADAEALMWGFPRKSVKRSDEATVVATYRWATLLKDYGGMRLRYLPRTGEVIATIDFSPVDNDEEVVR